MKDSYVLPNYNGGSIVNLMSSVKKALGGRHPYKELKILPSKKLKQAKNIVLIVLDGIGYTFLKKNANGTIFDENLKGSMTSVFPSTTGAAIPTFSTGLAPQQHAFTGWHMYLKELGVVSTTLRFNLRIGGESFSALGIDIKNILSCKGFSEGLKVNSYLITSNIIAKGDFTKATAGKSKIIGYSSLKGFFNQISKTVKSRNHSKFIYGYWDKFDSIAHKKGVNSKEIKAHYLELCDEVSKLVKRLRGTSTKIIVTSDHGFINTTKEEFIDLKNHPKLNECLTLPLCGDPRVRYCYVRPGKVKKFEKYVKTKLKNYCNLYKSKDIIDKGFFGLFKPNPQLHGRIGDYILIMKGNYVFNDSIFGSEQKFKIGRHSGLSRDEMLVPLILIDC